MRITVTLIFQIIVLHVLYMFMARCTQYNIM